MKIYTHNLAIDNDNPERRYRDFSDRVFLSQPDVIFAQEVSSNLGYRALQSIVQKSGGEYSMRFETVYPGQEDEQGVAVLSRLPILGSSMTTYTDRGNQSQIIKLGTKNGSIVGANVHHEASPFMERIRMRKNKELSDQLANEHNESGHILAGDFNAWPKFPSIYALQKRHGFVSAFKSANKYYQDTYPTMSADYLLKQGYMKPSEIDVLRRGAAVTNFFQNEKHEIPSYTIDYIFLRNIGRTITAQCIRSWKDLPNYQRDKIASQRTSQDAWPISDHFGVEVEVSETTS